MESNVQHMVKQVSKFDGNNADDFLEWSSEHRVSLSLYSKPIFETVQGSQRPSGLDNDHVTAREGWDDANHNLFRILYFTTSGPAFSVMRRFEGKTREDGVGHGQDAWVALREKFDGCSREALQAANRELETVRMRSDEDPDDFLYKKDRCRDRLNSLTPKEGPSYRHYEDIMLQCLPPEYDRIRQTHFEREDCSLADIWRMMSKIYADNLARSHSDSSRGIAGRGIAMQATRRDLSKIICHYRNKFGHHKNDCGDFKAVHHQNRRRRHRHGTTSSEADISRISRSRADSSSRGEGGKCGAHTIRPLPTATPTAAPGRQTGSTATSTSPKSALRVSLGSAARGISLGETTLTRSPTSHSRRERSNLRRSPPKPE